MPQPMILQVAVPAPLYQCFDYLAPRYASGETLFPGQRIRVTFGRGECCGVIMGVSSQSDLPLSRLKPAIQRLDETPLFSEGDLGFLQWAAEYYHHPIGEVVTNALPVRLRQGKPIQEGIAYGWRLTAEGAKVNVDTLRQARRQRDVLDALQGKDVCLPTEALGVSSQVIKRMLALGWLERAEIMTSTMVHPQVDAPRLNLEQQAAVAAVMEHSDCFTAFLLDGVTGSGKTEVYLRLIEQVLARGQQVLVIVPEIGLTPQLQQRFLQRLSMQLALMHSGLAEGERELAWQQARLGRAGVVLGTRSALFTPMPRLGLIIVDEEHDLSLKQQDGFRYSARDLAVVRAQRLDCPVVLGSATPSLESLYNVNGQRYRHLRLQRRAGTARPPRIDLIDIRSVRLDAGVSPTLLRMTEAEIMAGNQVMLFLNRRGYAPVMTCHTCGWVSLCRRCDARMTLHRDDGLLWCHHCGAQQRRPVRCPECNEGELRAIGQGTERVEEMLQRRLPDVAALRIDRDATRRKGSLERRLKEIAEGRYPLLLGTQMLAKGHHFPDVTLVGILDVDQGLFGADFRAAERMAQLIVQVAGRAGRAEKPGQVLIQTRHPDHPLLQTLIHEGYGAFAAAALDERKAAEYPPYSYQCLLRADAIKAELPMTFLQEAAELLAGTQGVSVWGPVPAPMEKRAGRFRAQLLLQSPRRNWLHAAVKTWLPQLQTLPSGRRVRWSLDVDPQEML